VAFKLWAVGKFDSSVAVHMPRNSFAVVFAVPSPLDTSIVPHKRQRDVRVIDGGVLVLDTAKCSPRGFCVLLPHDRVYACHAAAIVHAKMNWQHHEVHTHLTLYVRIHRHDTHTRSTRLGMYTLAPLCSCVSVCCLRQIAIITGASLYMPQSCCLLFP
jgi:hypothetical protein